MTSPVACSTKWRKGGDKWHSVILRASLFELGPLRDDFTMKTRTHFAAQRSILRPWHGVGRAFPGAQTVAMDPSAGS
jgi:hypothetical protein